MSKLFINSDGTKFYYEGKKLHRIGGAAVINADGSQIYFENDKRHRIGGPAKIFVDGTQTHYSYYINGKRVTKIEHDLLYSIMKLKGLI
jgi:hypothetical protein